MTINEMLEIGNRAGVFLLYRWTKKWWQITFPDGSYEIVSGEQQNQLDESIIRGAFTLWSQRAFKRIVAEVTETEEDTQHPGKVEAAT